MLPTGFWSGAAAGEHRDRGHPAHFLDFGVPCRKQYRVHLRAVASFDADRRSVRVISDAQAQEIMFDQAIYALGSRVDVGGVAGCGRARLSLEAAEGSRSPSALRARLQENAGRPIRVVTVGGAETRSKSPRNQDRVAEHRDDHGPAAHDAGDHPTPSGKLARMAVSTRAP